MNENYPITPRCELVALLTPLCSVTNNHKITVVHGQSEIKKKNIYVRTIFQRKVTEGETKWANRRVENSWISLPEQIACSNRQKKAACTIHIARHPPWQVDSEYLKYAEKLFTPSPMRRGPDEMDLPCSKSRHTLEMWKPINYNLITRYARWREFNYSHRIVEGEAPKRLVCCLYGHKSSSSSRVHFDDRELLNLII